ncbi:ABC transporter permease [Streptomyces laurentii]|uniref:ABC transporter permease n=1 Tax=Streptomyces laurentii TaxID=39478 RepID=UPI0036804854
MVTFPVMFASSTFAPADQLPLWLRAVAAVNPLSYAVDASRSLALGQSPGLGVVAAVGTSCAVLAASITTAVRGFERPPSR